MKQRRRRWRWWWWWWWSSPSSSWLWSWSLWFGCCESALPTCPQSTAWTSNASRLASSPCKTRQPAGSHLTKSSSSSAEKKQQSLTHVSRYIANTSFMLHSTEEEAGSNQQFRQRSIIGPALKHSTVVRIFSTSQASNAGMALSAKSVLAPPLVSSTIEIRRFLTRNDASAS